MDKKIERLKEILEAAPADARCVAAAIAELNTIEVISEALAMLALIAKISDKETIEEGLIALMDDLADRIEDVNQHLEMHASVEEEIAHVEIPDDVSSLMD